MSRRPKNPDTPEFTSKYYLTNATLLPEVIKSKAAGKMSNELAKMLMMLAERYSRRSKFVGYPFRDDMVSEALINLCANALKFDTEKYSNPFAYYTTAVHNSFLQYLNNEKKHRNIRDSMLIELGENPSFNYMAEHKSGESLSSDNIGTREMESVHKDILNVKDEIVEAKARKVISDAKEAADKLLLAAENDIIDNEDEEDIVPVKKSSKTKNTTKSTENSNKKEFFQYEV